MAFCILWELPYNCLLLTLSYINFCSFLKVTSVMANVMILCFSLLLTSLLLQGVHSTTFTFKNRCNFTVWPGILTNAGTAPLSITGFELGSNASLAIPVPQKWSGRFWARQGCSNDASRRLSCQSADCGSGLLQCNNAGAIPPATLVEFTLNGADGKDFYDISNVDGFNLPVSIVPHGLKGTNCSSVLCSANINLRCPQELWLKAADGSVVGCKSACLAFNTDEYCCRGAYGSPSACRPSSYAQYFKKACPQAYSYAYDDATSTFTCIGADYLITFCPHST
ncbi:Thaumatin-like protein [Rhynchospora pubera]|uniref:Thaumatin-like protein n=1 Tax=Rhynchospora pubera TaxID=906938 RepID=A0AAV8BY18_9POAL|nr:Thaumatin-like protein [Rhynchospora pubera]